MCIVYRSSAREGQSVDETIAVQQAATLRHLCKICVCSVDIARGITVALMLYVNNADDRVPRWQPHAVWNGLHLADIVMPAFLVSIVLQTL